MAFIIYLFQYIGTRIFLFYRQVLNINIYIYVSKEEKVSIHKSDILIITLNNRKNSDRYIITVFF